MYSDELLRGSVDERCARISEKLDRIRENDWNEFQEEHDLVCDGFRLGPPLTECQLTAFEAAHAIRLPEAYRAFLGRIGNGGFGPYYGLLPLSEWGDVSDWDEERQRVRDGFLAAPSPLVPDMSRADDWMARLGCTSRTCFQGLIVCCSQGCSFYTGVIVSGPARGRVLNLDTELKAPAFTDNPDFLAWYERWLDDLLAGNSTKVFGYWPTGDERELILRSSNPAERLDLAYAFHRFPRLGEASIAYLRELAADDDPEVRAVVISAIVGTLGPRALGDLTQSLSDPDEEVRHSGVLAIARMESRPPAVLELIRTAALDRSARVADVAERLLNGERI